VYDRTVIRRTESRSDASIEPTLRQARSAASDPSVASSTFMIRSILLSTLQISPAG
jgi:hypothetical protein